jgi:hypothetical protein
MRNASPGRNLGCVNARSTPWNGWLALTMTVLATLLSAATLGWLLAENDLGGGGNVSDAWLVLVFGHPLAVSLITWGLLHHLCKSGSNRSGRLAEIGVSLYVVFALLAGLLGGLAVAAVAFPAAGFLLAAVLLTPRTARAPA